MKSVRVATPGRTSGRVGNADAAPESSPEDDIAGDKEKSRKSADTVGPEQKELNLPQLELAYGRFSCWVFSYKLHYDPGRSKQRPYSMGAGSKRHPNDASTMQEDIP